ncbi:hypothetical protein [Subtercola sp. RTI3]|uniref:hypothetical protein n=1 Tax=Subtercola sp. RTI3 TaxID=3048639 RepID=UPI002B23CCBA|nr:hypothetical protein [Subtercola sp. RTI3]MEA9986464.1 hypothetical protein [Subtercola sp. RTI3]
MSRFTSSKKRIAVIVTAAVLVLAGGGAAFAYWTSTGSGVGSATTGTDTAFTIASTTAGSALTPGGPTDTVTFIVTNPGTGNQNLTAITAAVATSTGAAWTTVPGCSAADYTVGTPVVIFGTIAPAGTLTGTVTITMNNTAANQNACRGAAVPLYFAAS